MKPNQVHSFGIVMIVLFSSCRSAPVLSEQREKANPVLSNIDRVKLINEQEQELESLAQSNSPVNNNVKAEEHHHVTYENVNGKQQEIQETEKAVLKNGQVVSDVKQEVTKTEDTNGKPETHVETEIDIPSKGIHEKFTDYADNDLIEEDRLPNPGLNMDNVEESFVTPQSLAEYLWDTQDFGKFRAALENIVASKIMTVEEAQGFYQEVVMEYDKLRQLNSLYPYQSEDEETFLSPLIGRPQYSNVIPGLPANEPSLPIESYAQKRLLQLPLYQADYEGISDYDLEQQREAYVLDAAMQREAAVDDMLRALLEDWFASAVESGDTDAAKLVSDLASYLSDQTGINQYDEEKVRQVLAEVLATMVNSEEEDSELTDVKPLPETDGIEKQFKGVEMNAEESQQVEKDETESSGEEDKEIAVPEKSS